MLLCASTDVYVLRDVPPIIPHKLSCAWGVVSMAECGCLLSALSAAGLISFCTDLYVWLDLFTGIDAHFWCWVRRPSSTLFYHSDPTIMHAT